MCYQNKFKGFMWDTDIMYMRVYKYKNSFNISLNATVIQSLKLYINTNQQVVRNHKIFTRLTRINDLISQ